MPLLSLVPGLGQIRMVLTFLSSKIGIALICLAVGFFSGYNQAKEKYQARELQAKVQQLQHDLATANAAYALERQQNRELEEAASANRTRVDDIVAELAKRTDRDICRLTEDEVRHLLEIK